MEHHLTERELIEYQFKLASDMQIKEAAEHLQGCGQCREHLEKLQRKFSALDLLRGEAKISEDLISHVVEQASQPVRTRIVWFKKYAWLSSAAAVLLIGVLLVATQLSKDGTKKREVAKGPTPVAEEMELASKPEITPVERLDKDAVRKRTFAMAPKEKEAGRYAAFGETAEAAIPEQPPFAPASAIELVTLPRRDKVQLTIYNSTFQTSIVDKGGYGGFGGPLGPRHGRGYREYGQPYGQPSDLIMLIQETIEPDSWFDMSDTGEGTIQVYDKKLFVRQTPQIHQKIKKLLQAIKALPDEQAKSESSTTIDQIRTDSFVYKQIDRIVDLSDLKPEMSFGEVIERLENSVQPPIQIQPNWKDLLENAEVERSTPAGMDPLTGVTLRKALEILLAGISSVDFAELNYVVDEGVILIGTMDMLRPKMETRVYNISDSGGGGGITSDSVKLKVEESKAQSQKRNVVSRRPVDILPDSLTLVRERRNLTLKKGWNWLQFMWANTLIDPTSLSLEPLAQADKIDIQQLVFPARLRELGRWLIRSEVSGQVPFEITYFTSGLSWRAFYMGTLSQDEKTMQLQGYVRVGNNSGEDYEKAQTRLIVGKVHILDQIAELAKRQYPYNKPISLREMGGRGGGYGVGMMDGPMMDGVMMGGMGGMGGGQFAELRRKEIIKEGLSEYFLYTIEGSETIPNQWGKRLLSFDIEDIEVESLYKYDEQRWANQTIRFVKFANDEDHNLGETPIPNGTVKIYSQADEQGHLSYVGGTSIKYIPVDEEVELNLGPARLVSVEPKLMDFKTDNYIFDRRGNVAGWDEIRTWKIEITNTRELPIEIEITRGFGTTYWTMRADIPYEKYDATHTRFKVNLEPRSKSTFEYTIMTYHGVREEYWTRKIKK